MLNINVKSGLFFDSMPLSQAAFELVGLTDDECGRVNIKGRMLSKLRATLTGLQV